LKESKELAILTNHGLAKFPIQQTSEQLFERNILFGTVGGVLLTSDSFLRKFTFSDKIARVSQRSRTINAKKVIRISLLGEFLWQSFLLSRQINTPKYIQRILEYMSFRAVDLTALKILKKVNPGEIDIYHCRSGFGGKSIGFARKIGIVTICEHTTAHPDYKLEQIDGALQHKFGIEKLIRRDLLSADQILVPSKWVSETFKLYPNIRNLNILTPPIDPEFRRAASMLTSGTRDIDVLFVGYVSELKGIRRLKSITTALPTSITVSIVGSWDHGLLDLRNELKNRSNFTIHDHLEHQQIAQIMKRTKIFLFPSLIEGAARVVDEATYAECLVMATSASFADEQMQAVYIDDLEDYEVVQKIQYFIENPIVRGRIASEALKELRNRDSNYMPQLIEFYVDTLSNSNNDLAGEAK